MRFVVQGYQSKSILEVTAFNCPALSCRNTAVSNIYVYCVYFSAFAKISLRNTQMKTNVFYALTSTAGVPSLSKKYVLSPCSISTCILYLVSENSFKCLHNKFQGFIFSSKMVSMPCTMKKQITSTDNFVRKCERSLILDVLRKFASL